MINITLPWPPSVNTYYRNVYGRTLISKKGREYRRTVLKEIIAQKATQGLSDARISLSLAFYPPTRRKYDADNHLKAIIDAMQHAGLFNDDEQIDEIQAIKMDPELRAGQVLVHLTPIA